MSHCSFYRLLLALTFVVRGVGLGEERQWPFNVPKSTALPQVKLQRWVRNDIDRFILARLEAEALEPAAEADRRTLIRRLYFDLIGLPPKPEEVQRFLADKQPQAYERVVDRLLKDPRYGERWARLWLDLTRYADTAGYEGDPDTPHSWRYRDYVIDSLIRDKPYDQFIKEQIAGDEFQNILGAGDLPAPKAENVVALTFLRLAPFTEPRGDETRHELLSEMTSTVSSVFLGLTVGCAKCHDHKYDDIPTKDFYRMKAFFSTVQIPRPEPGDAFQIGGPIPAAWYRKGEAGWAAKKGAALRKEIGTSKVELAELRKTLEKRLKVGGAGFALQSMGGELANNYVFDPSSTADGKLHYSIVSSNGQRWAFRTDGRDATSLGGLAGANRGHWFGHLKDVEYVSLGKYTNGTGTPQSAGHQGHFSEVLIYDRPLDAQATQTVEKYLKAKYQEGNPSTNRPPQKGLKLWLDAADIDADPKTVNPKPGTPIRAWVDKRHGLRLQQTQAALQPKMSVLGPGSQPAVLFDDDFLAARSKTLPFAGDKQGAMVVIYSATHSGEGYGFEVGGGGAFISTAIYPNAPSANSLKQALADRNNELISDDERRRYDFLSTREPFIKQQLKRLKPVAMSLRHSYGPPYEPGVPTSRVMIRGEYNKPGEVVKAGFLSCITGNQESAKIRLDPFKRWPTRSRRLALAEWIASSSNPLAARVMVNRLWHWHFGRGIVTTPSDFGKLGGGPSHEALLDWLAVQFVKNKWSLKSMHRLMVTSATYRQSSHLSNKAASEVDPENQLLWRFRRRRLEAEAVRDSILSVSGRLNPQQFGLPIFPPLPDDIAQRVKYTTSKWATQYGPEGRKRSIYIYQQRTLSMPFLQVFDSLVCDESRPRRRESITPLQALAMYNGNLVNDEATFFAQRIAKEAGEQIGDQIVRAFQLALARAPTTTEAEQMTKLVKTYPTRDEALIGLCRVLFNTNEFVYVD